MVRQAGVCVAVAACMIAGAPGRAQDALDAAAVQLAVIRAAGVRPASEHIVTNFVRGGVAGVETETRAGSDYRVETVSGPFTTAHGSVRGVTWQQNENGETVLTDYDAEHEGEERSDEPMHTTVVRQSNPDRYVVERLTALGCGTKDYVDPSTWRIVRHEGITPFGTRVVTFDDFRATAGYVRAWHWTVSDGEPEDDAEYRIANIDTSAVAPGALDVPGPRRTLVEFPAGVESVPLPAQLDRDARFVVRVTIGKRGLDFMLDTGAARLAIDRDVARDLGLAEYATYSNPADAGRYVGTRTIVPEMHVGALTMHDAVFETIPHVEGDSGRYRIVGLLGFDFLEQLGLALDYRHSRAIAYAPGAFVAPSQRGTIALDVRLGSHQPETGISINGARGERFVLDTGGAGALLIEDYFRRLHPGAVVDEDGNAGRSQTMAGLGGRFETKVYELAAMSVGNETYEHVPANVITSPSVYATNQDGLIGPDFLQLFTLYTDYPDRRVYLTPSGDGRTPTIPSSLDRTPEPVLIPVPSDDLPPTPTPIRQR